MQILLIIIFGTISAVIAFNKGFNPFIWFFAAGLLGLIVLVFLPSAKAALPEDPELYEEREKTGNNVGILLLCVGIVFMVISFIALMSMA